MSDIATDKSPWMFVYWVSYLYSAVVGWSWCSEATNAQFSNLYWIVKFASCTAAQLDLHLWCIRAVYLENGRTAVTWYYHGYRWCWSYLYGVMCVIITTLRHNLICGHSLSCNRHVTYCHCWPVYRPASALLAALPPSQHRTNNPLAIAQCQFWHN